MIKTIGIIGSAGRQGDAEKVTPERFEWILKSIEKELINEGFIGKDQSQWNGIEFISGGAAFVDHAAVVLSLAKGVPLKLCLPAPWDERKKQFHDKGIRNWKENPGVTSNFYHREFSKRVNRDSLNELNLAIPNSTVMVDEGFHARNTLIAGPVDLLLAFTFSKDPNVPGSSGTLSTWKKSKAIKKIHRAIIE